jgi:hypothetical protein
MLVGDGRTNSANGACGNRFADAQHAPVRLHALRKIPFFRTNYVAIDRGRFKWSVTAALILSPDIFLGYSLENALSAFPHLAQCHATT